MSDDFLCIGYEGMSRAIIDHNGERVFSPEQIRKRFKDDMKSQNVIFKMKIGKGYVQNWCAWFSDLKEYFQEKREI